MNGCSFCIDLGQRLAQEKQVSLEKFFALQEYRTNPLFSGKEKAALQYVEEVTRNRAATPETFEQLRTFFSDDEIVDITWLNAVENYYNLIARPLGLSSDGLCAIKRP